MRSFIYLFAFCLLTYNCSDSEDFLKPEMLANPSSMIVHCMASPTDTLKLVEYEYENDKLISESTYVNGFIQSSITYQYNSDNKLISEIYLDDYQKTESTYIYDELTQLINVYYKDTKFDSTGSVIDIYESEAPREYVNMQLVKEWEYWGGFNTYKYSKGKLVSKTDHRKNGDKHHITTYRYFRDLLIEEKKFTAEGRLIYSKQLEYDSQQRLIRIRDGENVIEENDYSGNKLTEKRIYYFGIDPGFYACSGNFVYSYVY